MLLYEVEFKRVSCVNLITSSMDDVILVLQSFNSRTKSFNIFFFHLVYSISILIHNNGYNRGILSISQLLYKKINSKCNLKISGIKFYVNYAHTKEIYYGLYIKMFPLCV